MTWAQAIMEIELNIVLGFGVGDLGLVIVVGGVEWGGRLHDADERREGGGGKRHDGIAGGR
jgi:hypothetical protein